MFGNVFDNFDIKSLFDTTTTLGQIVELVIYAVIAAVATTVILLIYGKFVKNRLKAKNNLTIRFTQNIIRVAIILIAVIWVLVSSTATTDIGKVLFQGTAILGAVFGLAAQPVLGDFFSGIAITLNRPFEIGDWIELENGTAGVVADITPRHVVLRSLGTVEIIVPNSKINALMIKDTSFKKLRSTKMEFNVAYGTDVDKASEIIKNAVTASELTVPAKDEDYGPVFFEAFADSSLVLTMVVYYKQSTSGLEVKTDVNKRVNDAFNEAGIEIPFNYVNVVMQGKD
ncbi:small conductance mechanosensitive channel [Ruminococcaceae bacterium R-25]|nr:small conductance mechanosensitive channel [Ruminococcaceae bacterium R-25]SUQ21498.1 Mechanosensitive ion channel [Oscillospiraceae bacterium]